VKRRSHDSHLKRVERLVVHVRERILHASGLADRYPRDEAVSAQVRRQGVGCEQ
jgi:hypothetical protein